MYIELSLKEQTLAGSVVLAFHREVGTFFCLAGREANV